ncbi:MAG TPA: GntR family transcriptional regulator [Terriglobia bacterium]|nr:GntR family transcriptional regulator [Terriglobia bacterium]
MKRELGLEHEVIELSEALERRTSIPDQVAHTLRKLILSGRLAPGQRVIETKIAKQLGIGQPTVREGLKTLAGEGLVIHQPNRGYCVTSLTNEQVDQIFRLRVEWETLAVELALENRDIWTPRELEKVLKSLTNAAQDGNVEEYYRHDLQFHLELWQLSGNPYLVRSLSQITVPFFAYCMVRRLTHLDMDLQANAREHEQILQALLTEDKEHARQVTRTAMESFHALTQQLTKKSA